MYILWTVGLYTGYLHNIEIYYDITKHQYIWNECTRLGAQTDKTKRAGLHWVYNRCEGEGESDYGLRWPCVTLPPEHSGPLSELKRCRTWGRQYKGRKWGKIVSHWRKPSGTWVVREPSFPFVKRYCCKQVLSSLLTLIASINEANLRERSGLSTGAGLIYTWHAPLTTTIKRTLLGGSVSTAWCLFALHRCCTCLFSPIQTPASTCRLLASLHFFSCCSS